MQIYQLFIIVALATLASGILTAVEIPILKRRQFRQFIREEGPQSHQSKAGRNSRSSKAYYKYFLSLYIKIVPFHLCTFIPYVNKSFYILYIHNCICQSTA